MKAVSTSLNTAFSSNILAMFQATLNLFAFSINHCLAVLCKFSGGFWKFWERDTSSQMEVELRKKKHEMLKI